MCMPIVERCRLHLEKRAGPKAQRPSRVISFGHDVQGAFYVRSLAEEFRERVRRLEGGTATVAQLPVRR